MSTAFYFGPEDRPLFGWLHAARSPSELGLVLLGPFGYEAICAHRTLRHLAEQAAHAGVSSLRFDYDGAGDSAGSDRDPDRLGAWVKSAHSAADALGTKHIVFCGFRLGALVALLAACERNDVLGIIAIDPVVSGRAYLRELRFLQATLSLAPDPEGARTDTEEAAGFALTAETRAALADVDLSKVVLPAESEVLLLERADLPTATGWAQALAAAGTRVEVRKVPGLVEMRLDPHQAVVPQAAISAVIDWAVQRNRATLAAPPRGVVERRGACVGEAVMERPAMLDDGLVGILTEPAPGAKRSGRATLLLNAGAVHRVGPNRLWTRLARRWAAQGHVTLRMDLAGLGDSSSRPGTTDNVVYPARALDDVAIALVFLKACSGVVRMNVMGVCSGAYHAFKAAVRGLPVERAVVINPLTFFWHEQDSLEIPDYRAAHEVARYSKSILHLDAWQKLLRGRVDLVGAARTVARHAANLALGQARDLSRSLGFVWREDLGAELETIAKRGIGLDFIFSTGDPGLPLLRMQAGSVLPRLEAQQALSITTLADADHTFTALASQELLMRTVDALLDRAAPALGALGSA